MNNAAKAAQRAAAVKRARKAAKREPKADPTITVRSIKTGRKKKS